VERNRRRGSEVGALCETLEVGWDWAEYLCAVSAVVEDEGVAGLRVLDELGQAAADVFARGLGQAWVAVQHHQDVGFVEGEPVQEQRLHAAHVVGASMELALGARVVAPDQQCPLRHCARVPPAPTQQDIHSISHLCGVPKRTLAPTMNGALA
jgi:hypothetical protein